VAGFTASSLHGAKWVDDSRPVELLHDNRHRMPGLLVHGDTLLADEVVSVAGIPVTTPARTALDLSDIARLAERHAGRRGSHQARKVIDLADAGAESPRESYLRLLIVQAGLPRPATQIPVYDRRGYLIARVDMGWEGDWRIAVEYDGDHHRTDERQFARDIARVEALEAASWIVIRVTAKDSRPTSSDASAPPLRGERDASVAFGRLT
jgi:hypothetical protein